MPNCMTEIGFIRTLPMGAMGDNRTSMVLSIGDAAGSPVAVDRADGDEAPEPAEGEVRDKRVVPDGLVDLTRVQHDVEIVGAAPALHDATREGRVHAAGLGETLDQSDRAQGARHVPRLPNGGAVDKSRTGRHAVTRAPHAGQ